MEIQDLRILQLLDEIHKGSVGNQRILAKKLNISLGLANASIKQLEESGHISIRNHGKKKRQYLLTENGVRLRWRLTGEFLRYSCRFFGLGREKMEQVFDSLWKRGVKKIVFFGGGDFAEMAFLSLRNSPIRLVAVIDERPEIKTHLFDPVTDPEKLFTMDYDCILITAEDGSGGRIVEWLSGNGVPEEKVVTI
jgi:predicted transcriptional regulator